VNRKTVLAGVGLLAGLLLSLPATAAVITNASFPFSLTVFVPCAAGGMGEVVELTGRLHDTFGVTANSNGLFHLEVHDNPQGVSGIGQTTGDRYKATGMTRFQIVSDAPYEIISVDNFKIIGPGPGNNFTVHDNLHIRIDGEGQVTAFHDNFRAQCK
jgi:hypothetical protein